MKAERIKHKMTKNDMRLCYLRSKYKNGVGYSELYGYTFVLNSEDVSKCVDIIPYKDLEIEQYKLMTWYWTDAVVIRDKLKRIGKEFDIIPFSVIENRSN